MWRAPRQLVTMRPSTYSALLVMVGSSSVPTSLPGSRASRSHTYTGGGRGGGEGGGQRRQEQEDSHLHIGGGAPVRCKLRHRIEAT